MLLIPLSTLPLSFTRETIGLIYTSNKVWYSWYRTALWHYMINIIWHGPFRITCRIYPLPISSLELKFSKWYVCLGLIQDVIRKKTKIFIAIIAIGTRSPFCHKKNQNMPLKINLICIWHHYLVHCFPFCLNCKSNKA